MAVALAVTTAQVVQVIMVTLSEDGSLTSVFHPKVRLGNDVNDDVDEDPTGNKALWDRGLLNGASQKAEVVANFHVGETINTLEVRAVICVEELSVL